MSAKKILLLLTLMVNLSFLNAMGNGIPVLGVVDTRSINAEHIGKFLWSKLNKAITDCGAQSEEGGLILVAELVPVSKETVETGMRKIQLHTYSLHLRMEQPFYKQQFGVLDIDLKGSGYDVEKAAMDAVRNFNQSETSVENFIRKSISSANDYYQNNINRLIQEADLIAKGGQYDEAIAMLWALPKNTDYSPKINTQLEKVYLMKQNHDCGALLAKAKSAYAIKNYTQALEWISQIDSYSNCHTEALQLTSRIAKEIRIEDKEELARQERSEQRYYKAMDKESERAAKLEGQRISAIAGVAKAYFNSHKSVYHYLTF